MKTVIKVKKEVDIRFVKINIHIRYLGDGDDDDVSPSFPLIQGSQWKATVDVDTGVIEGWPQGVIGDIHVKAADAGIYTLIDSDGNAVAEKDGYVPNGLIPGEYGDYVDLEIDETGKITNWPRKPDFSDFFNEDDD